MYGLSCYTLMVGLNKIVKWLNIYLAIVGSYIVVLLRSKSWIESSLFYPALYPDNLFIPEALRVNQSTGHS